jgi:hypothetical protein
MSVNRKAFVILSSALMAVAVPCVVPGVVRADDHAVQSAQQSQDQQNAKVAGTIESYHNVNVDGSEHFRVRVKESNEQTKSVDLGESDRCKDLIDNLEQGDQITASGQIQKIDGKQVVIADRASVDGKSYPLGQADKEERETGNRQNEGDESRGQANAGDRQSNENQQSQKPAAVLLLDERMVFVGEGDLNRHLILAKEDLSLGDSRSAAGELRVAADRIDLYANASHEKSRAANLLNQSREDLEHLADQIGKNSNSVKPHQIDDAAAQSQAALAKYYDEQIQSREAKDRPIETGYDLQAAAIHTREAMVWSDENVSDHAARSISTAMKTADDLLSGNQKAGGDAQQVAQNLNQQIDQLDQSLDQSRAKAPSARMSPDQKNTGDRQPDSSSQQPNRRGA